MRARLHQFIARFPQLLPTLARLDGAGIPYAIGGSGCLFLLGNERTPDDVDIYLPDDRHDEADVLFGIKSFTYESPLENVRNSNPGGSNALQLTSHLILTAEGRRYPLSLNDQMLRQATRIAADGQTMVLLPPEDVLLIKALLQRGEDVGKHDVADIANFMKGYPNLDRIYLESRVADLQAVERVGDILRWCL